MHTCGMFDLSAIELTSLLNELNNMRILYIIITIVC